LKRLRAILAAVCIAGAVAGMAGCAGHSHSEETPREAGVGGYTCPHDGGTYDSPKDHCKVCGMHVQKK
jgi:hypothetical protein